MARIAGVDLPKNKHMDRALTYIHGIGLTSARKILDTVDLPYTMNSDDLSGDDVTRIRKVLETEYIVEGDRRREVSMDIKRLTDLGCYRGDVIVWACPSADRKRRRTPEQERAHAAVPRAVSNILTL